MVLLANGAMLLTPNLAGVNRNDVLYHEVFETSQNEVLRCFNHTHPGEVTCKKMYLLQLKWFHPDYGQSDQTLPAMRGTKTKFIIP